MFLHLKLGMLLKHKMEENASYSLRKENLIKEKDFG
jgi:hypothetical protein